MATDAQRQEKSCTFTIIVEGPPRLSATRFVAFGDSITEGKTASGEILTNASYPADLQSMLQMRYTAQMTSVLNAGCGGETAAAGAPPCMGGVRRLPSVLSANPDAQVLLLLEGVNDLTGGDPASVPPMIEALRTMVHQAQARNLQVFLGTLLPERPGGRRSSALPSISAANDQIRQLALGEGANLVDLFQGFGGSPDPYIDVDGLHPNAMGYQKIAQLFFDSIRANLELSSSVRNLVQRTRPAPFIFNAAKR